MTPTRLFLVAALVGSLAVLGCGDETTGTAGSGGSGSGGSGTAGSGGSGTAGSGGNGTAGSGGAPIPSEACDTGLCATDGELRALCEQDVQACLANEPEINWDECILGVQAARCEDIGG
jgi:hypothetical protein